MNINDVTADQLLENIHKILQDKSYKERVMKVVTITTQVNLNDTTDAGVNISLSPSKYRQIINKIKSRFKFFRRLCHFVESWSLMMVS